jgi:hypothetical protein
MTGCRVRSRQFSGPQKLIASLAASGQSNGRPCPKGQTSCSDLTTSFGEIANIHLGGVTGDAKYFLLSDDQRRTLGLPINSVIPIVSRARQLRKGFIDEAEWKALLNSGERVWLFNPPQSLLHDAAVSEYLNLGLRDGGCDRQAYKIRNRDPWYRTPLPPSPHAFLSGMDDRGPWMCFNEMPRLNATNTLYVVRFRDEVEENMRFGWALALLASPVQRQCRRVRRRYADGLTKYEPGGIAGLRLPHIRPHLRCRELYAEAIRHLLHDDRTAARTIADQALI